MKRPQSTALLAGALILFGLLFVYPLARFLLLPLFPSWAPVSASISSVGSGLTRASVNSLVLGLLAAAISSPLGAAMAWWMQYRKGWLARAQSLALWILFFTPSYVMTTGWQTIFTLPLLRTGWAERSFYSAVGIVFMLTLKALPFAAFVARPTWAGMSTELLDAMSVHGLYWSRRLRILSRLALPAVAAAFVVGFIESIQDFGIPATLGAASHMPLLTYAIYQQVSTSPLNFVGASKLSLILMLMAIGAAALHWYVQNKYRAVLVSGRQSVAPMQGRLRVTVLVAAVATGLLWVLGLLGPATAIMVAACSARSTPGVSSLMHSVGLAGIASSVAVLIAIVTARAIVVKRNAWVAGLEGFSLVNMAVPGLILGAAYLMAFNNNWLPLYGTPLLLVIGYVAATAPMLTRLLQPPIAHIDQSLLEAAKVHGISWLRRSLDIEGVLMAPPLLRGWVLAFGTVLFELPISALLYPAGMTPLGVRIMTMNQEFHFDAASRLALLGLIVALGVRLVVNGLGRFSLPRTVWSALR